MTLPRTPDPEPGEPDTAARVLGLIGALLWQGDRLHLTLAALTVVHLAATLDFARQQNRLLTEALLARFEKEALANQLTRQVALTQLVSDEKTRFFAAASHDLRQPLHAIALFGAVLEKDRPTLRCTPMPPG